MGGVQMVNNIYMGAEGGPRATVAPPLWRTLREDYPGPVGWAQEENVPSLAPGVNPITWAIDQLSGPGGRTQEKPQVRAGLSCRWLRSESGER